MWPLLRGKPRIEVVLFQAIDGCQTTRNLLADTGAGSNQALFDLILEESDCLTCEGNPTGLVQLGGAYSGAFPLYSLRVAIAQLRFDHNLRVVGVPSVPFGFDGIAGFRFLSGFTYGNFSLLTQFGLEM